MRLVSLACSNTEIVAALGCASHLVGVDDHSDFPAAALADLPRVGPDLEIDVGAVAALKPDLVLASLTVPGHETVVEGVEAAGLPVLVLGPERLDEVAPSVEALARALDPGIPGVGARGAALAARLREAFGGEEGSPELTAGTGAGGGEGAGPGGGTVGGPGAGSGAGPVGGPVGGPGTGREKGGATDDSLPPSSDPSGATQPPSSRPRILVQWWPRPVIAPGARSWVDGMIHLAGGENVLGTEDRLSRPLEDEEVVELAPDAIVLSWCGVEPDRYRPEVVYRNPAFAQVPAVQEGRVFRIPEAWMGRPGPRLLDGLGALRRVVGAVREGGGRFR